ncbi:hypothetical protein H4582DRAFT_654075 [Lactarius indigo]|nr:hypothetical protein H4582DRAFT_654075 [Lactarius indigo]
MKRTATVTVLCFVSTRVIIHGTTHSATHHLTFPSSSPSRCTRHLSYTCKPRRRPPSSHRIVSQQPHPRRRTHRPERRDYLLSISGPSPPASPVSSVLEPTLRNPTSSLSPASLASALPIPHKSSTTPYPYPVLDVSHPPPDADSPPATDVVQDFKAAAIRLLERFSQDTSQSARKRESWSRIAHLVEESEPHKAAALADAIVSAVGAEHADKLVLLSTESPSLRLQHVTNVLAKQLSIVEVSSKIATAVDESLSKQQKALFLRQQLAAISAELQRLEPGNTDLHGTGNGVEDEDELDLLIRRVDTLPVGSEVRRAATAEARRLKRIPPQNAEHGVVRTYLEWLTSLPWTPPVTASETSHTIGFPHQLPNHSSTPTIMASKRSSVD